MRWAAFRIGLGQQVGAILAENFGNRLRIEQFRVDWVAGGARLKVLDESSELLGPEPALDQPFLEPGGLQRQPGRPVHKIENMWCAEGGKTDLGR